MNEDFTMVAPSTLRPFYESQPVRVLVAFFSWAHREGSNQFDPNPDAYQRRGSDGPAARTLTPGERLRFIRYRHNKPGSCLVADESGTAWICPVDFLVPETSS